MKRWMMIAAALATSATAPVAMAQGPASVAATNQVRATVVVQPTAAAANEGIGVALQLEVAEGWHVYWRNPGEVGLPTKVEWVTPPGWKIEGARWPAPGRTESGGVVSHTLTGEVPLLFTVHPPADVEGPHTLELRVSYGVCREVCIPQRLKLAVRVLEQPSPRARREWTLAASRAMQRLPLVARDDDVTGHPTRGGVCLAVRTRGAIAPERMTFVPDTTWPARNAVVARTVRRGDWTRMRLPLPDSSVRAGLRIRGAVIGVPRAVGGPARAIEVDVVAEGARRAC